MCTDDKGYDYIKLEDKEHVCKPVTFDPKKFMVFEKLRKPQSTIMETDDELFTSQKHLIIFPM